MLKLYYLSRTIMLQLCIIVGIIKIGYSIESNYEFKDTINGFPGQWVKGTAFTTLNTTWVFDQLGESKEYTLKGNGDLYTELANDKIFMETWEMAMKNYENNPNTTIAAIAKTCYTITYPPDNIKSFYLTLNRALREWYAQKKTEVFPYKNYLDILLNEVKTFDRNITLYRGEYFTTTPIGTKGSVIWSDKLQSFTATKSRALNYLVTTFEDLDNHNYNGTMYILKTDRAINVTVDSDWPTEDEYIIPPNEKFIIQDVRLPNKEGDYIEIELVPAFNNQPVVCTKEGYQADPNDKHKFIECEFVKDGAQGGHWWKHEMLCAPGTKWSQDSQTCVMDDL